MRYDRLKNKRFLYAVCIILIGIVLNFIGFLITESANNAFRLELIGTIFAAAFGGYLPGITTGFITNLLLSLKDYNQLSYGFINITIAYFTVLLVHKGLFDKLWRVFVVIPVFSLYSESLNFLVAFLFGEVKGKFINDLLWDLFGKTVIFLLAYSLLFLFKDKISIKERYVKYINKNKKCRIISIRAKIVMILTGICIIIALAISFVAYRQFRDEVIKEHIKLGQGATNLIVNRINVDNIDNYINKGHDADGYDQMENYLYSLKKNYPDIQYIYIYRMLEDGVQVVFDLDTAEFEGDEPGDMIDYEESLYALKDRFLRGEEIEATISDDVYGFVLSVYSPIYNRAGQVSCYACVDFSMNVLNVSIVTMIIRIITIFIGFMLQVLAICIKVMEDNIIQPVNAMADCQESFAYDSEEERIKNIKKIQKLKINTGDEIENLYNAIIKTTEDSMGYVENLKNAQKEVKEMEQRVSEISVEAHTDALTGVNNKMAYQEMSDYLTDCIKEGNAEFAIGMIDLNHLKKINDIFGHEKGDLYLKGTCKMICKIYKNTPVYRFGGDEFVVVLTGKAYKQRNEKCQKLKEAFIQSSMDLNRPEWERYSAAIGIAEYDPDQDKDAADVFKRADELMYKDKVEMKAIRVD